MDQPSLRELDLNYPISLGSKPVCDTLQKILLSPNDNTDIVMVNLSTIARNVCEQSDLRKLYQENPSDQVLNEIEYYINNEACNISHLVWDCFRSKPYTVPRYFYLYTYQYNKIIPEQYYKHTCSKLHEIIRQRNHHTGLHDAHTAGNYDDSIEFSTSIEFHAGPYSKIYSIYESIKQLKNYHNVLMVSHHPIDYHICSRVNNFGIIRSFTGQYVTKDNLSEVVFKTKYLPFFGCIHTLVGDDTDIKPALKLSMRRKFLELAKNESWYLLSEEDIIERLHKLGILQPYNPL
jgi:hypothetical protein